MLAVKKTLQTQTDDNSLIDQSRSDLSFDHYPSGNTYPSLKQKYKNEYEIFKAENNIKMKEKFMKLDYVIKHAL